MATLVWIDNQGKRHEDWSRETSALCHSAWKKWPGAMINWRTRQITILVDGKDVVVANIICE